MEEKSYEALCEEQRRPYLQWLKKQEQELHTECDIEKGKQVVRLPFCPARNPGQSALKRRHHRYRSNDSFRYCRQGR